jgi:hypothetical protein
VALVLALDERQFESATAQALLLSVDEGKAGTTSNEVIAITATNAASAPVAAAALRGG